MGCSGGAFFLSIWTDLVERCRPIRTESGRGRHGEWSEDLISGATAKYVFLTVANQERADAFLEALAPLLETHGLVVLRSNVDVIRPDRF